MAAALHPRTLEILARYGIGPRDLIDSGRESEVFALGGDRILRVLRERGDVALLVRRQQFLASIDGRLPLRIPAILSIDPEGWFTVERRLPGTSLLRLLPTLAEKRRPTALRNFIAAASDGLSRYDFPNRPYGHLFAADPITAETWTGFLARSLDRAIARNRTAIAAEIGDVERLQSIALALLADVPEQPESALVHGDWFPGNVLMDDDLSVTGVVDFSGYAMIGDPLYDVLTAPVFLEMIDEASAADASLAQALVVAQLGQDAMAAQRFYRAHAAFWMADPALALPPYPRLYPWAIANLSRLAEG